METAVRFVKYDRLYFNIVQRHKENNFHVFFYIIPSYKESKFTYFRSQHHRSPWTLIWGRRKLVRESYISLKGIIFLGGSKETQNDVTGEERTGSYSLEAGSRNTLHTGIHLQASEADVGRNPPPPADGRL